MLNEKMTMDEAAAEAQKKTIDSSNKACIVCKKDENLISCNNCNDSYHFYCLKNPSLEKLFLNENEWNCPKCDLIQPTKIAEIILSWRWAQISHSDSIFPNEGEGSPKESEKLTEPQILKPSKSQNREKEFYIKWKNSTYWNCSWVSEAFIKAHFSPLLEDYLVKEAKLETSSQKFYVDSNKISQTINESDWKEKEIGQHSEQIPNYHLFL